jgi:hypothetical protein
VSRSPAPGCYLLQLAQTELTHVLLGRAFGIPPDLTGTDMSSGDDSDHQMKAQKFRTNIRKIRKNASQLPEIVGEKERTESPTEIRQIECTRQSPIRPSTTPQVVREPSECPAQSSPLRVAKSERSEPPVMSVRKDMIGGIGRDRGNRLRSRLHPLPVYAHRKPGLPISPRGWRCLTRDQVVGERYGIRRRIVRQVQSRGHNHTSVLARFRVVLGAWTAFLRSCRARSRLLCASRKSGMLWEYRVRVKDVR